MPVTNAQIRVLDTPYTTNSGAGGGFNITNIPSGVGYVLTVSAAGYAVQRFPNINIAPGPNDVGNLSLGNLINLPVQLRPLVPDVNPKVTAVEQGGTAYRYYQVVATDGRTLPGGVTVELRRVDGLVVPQGGSSSSEWAGKETGKPDTDGHGLVRLELPAEYIGDAGITSTFDVLIGPMVKQTFTATVKPREYQQVWKKKWHGVVGADLKVGSAGLGFRHETTVRREFANNNNGKEVIGHVREEVYRVGVGVGQSVRVNRIGGGISGGLKGQITAGLGQSFHFDPQTADPLDNLTKFYAAYADALNFVPFGGSIIEGVQQRITSGGPVEATVGAIRVTGLGEAEAGIGGLSPLPGEVAIHFWAASSGDLEVELGVENHPDSHVDRHLEFGAGWSRDVQWKLSLSDTPQAMFRDRDNSLRATVRRTADDKKTKELIVESTVEITSDTPRTIGGWLTDDLVLLKSQEVAEYKSRCTLNAPSASTALPIAINAWQALNGLGQGSVFRSRDGAEMVSSLLSAGQTVAYEKSVYSAKATVGSVLPNFNVVLSVDASASDERGAEIKKQSGVIWKNLLLGLESYQDQPENYYPAQTLSDLQGVWIANARAPLDQLLNKAQTTVSSAAETVIEAGREGAAAVVRFGQGVMSGAAQVTTSWVHNLFDGGQFAPNFALKNSPPQSLSSFLPTEGASNYGYGVGGVYRFESTNAFNGAATLTIPYTEAEVADLNEADLRIYHLPDGTNRWQLLGGVVNALSNTVTTTITNLGTFAIAPPLPAGDLILSVASNSLTADGVATSIITVSNLTLNNGQQATQSWLYTVAVSGVEIVETDVTSNYSGVQLVSTNGVLRFTVRAPLGGHSAKVAVASVAGDAAGELGINLVDNAPPLAPAGLTVSAGQSRLFVWWRTNAETDLAGYRVYYRAGIAGPPWDGTAAVEGSPSPVAVAGTNVTLGGLVTFTNYYLALTAVDTTGNESAPTVVGPLSLTNTPPQPPTGVAVSFGADGTNFLSWALSEDDGYNDRDVARYDIYQVILPGGAFVKIGEAPAGVGLFSGTNVPVAAGSYLRYAVLAIDTNGQSSAQVLANHFLAGGSGVDNDGDGMADDWELANGLSPTNPADANDDRDQDGLTNLQEYQRGSSPFVFDNLRIGPAQYLLDGRFQLTVFGEIGRSYVLEASTTLVTWTPLTTNVVNAFGYLEFTDTSATNRPQSFYRVKAQ